jgi:hypothetical protein
VDFLAVFDVDAAVLVDVKAQEPLGAFPDIFHIPQAAAEALYHRLGKFCD